MDKTDWQQKRQLKLTEVPVKSVHRDVADTGYDPMTPVFSDQDYDDHLKEFLPERPAECLHVFANFAGNLSVEEIADTLSVACGHWGRLKASGIHDPYLWQLQELVARRIVARYRNL